MPLNYSRRLAGNERTKDADRQLGLILAFTAGAINAGGFLAVQQYTSHMTGIVSAMADHVALGAYDLALGGVGALGSFICGAAFSALLVNYSRRHRMQSEYALPLTVEAILLLCFGMIGSLLTDIHGIFVSATVMLLCFIMGLQNAVITKLSNAEIRTTHITGIVTDIGIELGKLVYRNQKKLIGVPFVQASRPKLKMLVAMASSFFLGGLTGALGFKYVGYAVTMPLATVLFALVAVPVTDDITHFLKHRRRT